MFLSSTNGTSLQTVCSQSVFDKFLCRVRLYLAVNPTFLTISDVHGRAKNYNGLPTTKHFGNALISVRFYYKSNGTRQITDRVKLN